MEKKENKKVIDYKGKSVVLLKFNPLDGCYIIQQILTSFLPDVIESQLNINRPVKPKKSMSKDEFNELMTSCLKYAYYQQKEPVAVDIPILNDNGSIGVDGFDFSDTFILTLEVLAFNCLSFFSQENLTHFTGLMDRVTKQMGALMSN